MNDYTFFFRFNDCPAFQLHRIVVHASHVDAAIQLFLYIFTEAGLLEDLEAGSYGVSCVPLYNDDFIVSGEDHMAIPVFQKFADATIRLTKNLN